DQILARGVVVVDHACDAVAPETRVDASEGCRRCDATAGNRVIRDVDLGERRRRAVPVALVGADHARARAAVQALVVVGDDVDATRGGAHDVARGGVDGARADVDEVRRLRRGRDGAVLHRHVY